MYVSIISQTYNLYSSLNNGHGCFVHVHWKTQFFLHPMICHVALTLCVAWTLFLCGHQYRLRVLYSIQCIIHLYYYNTNKNHSICILLMSIITLNDGDTKTLVGHECMLPGIHTTIFQTNHFPNHNILKLSRVN